MEAPHRPSLARRMLGAALLDVPTYQDVAADATATPQAALVVAIVAVAHAFAQAQLGLPGALAGIASTYVAWVVWAGITYVIGNWLGGRATWVEMLRALGFSLSPGVLLIFGIAPVLGGLFVLVSFVWMLIAGIVGIRQALAVGTGRAIITAVLGFVPFVVIMTLITAMLNLSDSRT